MSELFNTIKQICDEKGLSVEAVVATIESALAAAYRKDFGEKNQNIKVEFDMETGKSKVFDVKTVVLDLPEEELAEMKAKEESAKEKKTAETRDFTPFKKEKKIEEPIKKNEGMISGGDASATLSTGDEEEKKFNPRTDLQISDAKTIKKTAKVGDEIKTKLEVPESYGRMAAQTAKQVIIQRLREAERDMVFSEFKDKEHEVISGVVQRREGRVVLIDLGKTVGILPSEGQIYGEQYKPGARIKVYVKEVGMGSKGPEIILSRTSEEILKKIFYLEIPEVSNGLVELKSVAREAGSRSKVAVSPTSENIDPIGSCVGQRGARIQTIISELGGEKVDIIEYDYDPSKFISNALSPAKVLSISLDEKEKKALIKVAGDQLSLAIGKGGQNVRLAARLTGWRIDIKEEGGASVVSATEDGQVVEDTSVASTGSGQASSVQEEKSLTKSEISKEEKEPKKSKKKSKKDSSKAEASKKENVK